MYLFMHTFVIFETLVIILFPKLTLQQVHASVNKIKHLGQRLHIESRARSPKKRVVETDPGQRGGESAGSPRPLPERPSRSRDSGLLLFRLTCPDYKSNSTTTNNDGSSKYRPES